MVVTSKVINFVLALRSDVIYISQETCIKLSIIFVVGLSISCVSDSLVEVEVSANFKHESGTIRYSGSNFSTVNEKLNSWQPQCIPR